MKKHWILVMAGVAAAAGLLLVSPRFRRVAPVAGRGLIDLSSLPFDLVRARSPVSLIPARAGLLIRARDLSDAWSRVASSQTFRRLTASPLWREEGVGERLGSARGEIEARLGFRLVRSRIREVAGRDVVLAVVPSGGDSLETLLVATRLGLRARLVEIALRLGDSLRDEANRFARQERYRGRTIMVLPPTDDFPLEVAYSVIDGYLVAAVFGSPRALVREMIDLARGEGNPLSDTPELAAALAGGGFAAPTFLECYLNPGRLAGGIGRGLPPGPAAEAAAWGDVLVRSLRFCRTLGFRAGYRNGIRSRLRIDLAGEGPERISGPSPGLPLALPAGEMFYGFFSLDPAAGFELAAGLLSRWGIESGPGGMPGLAAWEERSGLRLRGEILPALGGDWSLVLGSITGDEFLPLPPLALVNRVPARPAAEAVLDRLTGWAVLSRGLRPVRQTYRGVETTSFPGLFFSEPGYALNGRELIVAGSETMLRRMIDLGAAAVPSLDSNPLFRRTASGLDSGSGALVFLEAEKFLSSLRAVAEWYFAYQRLSPEEPIIPESIYRARIIPMLEMLRPVRAAAARLSLEKNIVKAEGFLYIPGPDQEK